MYTWQKILIVLLIVTILGLTIFVFFLNRKVGEKEDEISRLNQELILAKQVEVEPTTNIFRVTSSVRQGTIFDPTVVEVVPIPVSLVSDSFVTDPELLRGAIWRINVDALGWITKDMLAFEPIYPTDRFQVIMVDGITPSLEVGDFVDIRMITPDGIDFVVLPKKRITNLYTSGLELVMSETEWMIYIGSLIDKFMHRGTVVYASKYVDPSLQNRLYSTYIPPKEIVDFMNINMNMLFPYVEGTDVAGMRQFIESVQPWNRYSSTLFTTAVQAIRDREQKISSAIASQIGAMTRARGEYVQYMTQLYAANGDVWQGGSVQGTHTGGSSTSGGTSTAGSGSHPGTSSNVTSINPDGTWVDANGTLRNPDGTPVIETTDIINWGSTPAYEAPLDDSGLNIQVPDLSTGTGN